MAASDPIYQAFLDRLNRQRNLADISQVELARRLGITQSTVSKIFSGERRLDVAEAMRVSWHLGCSLEALLPDIDEAEKSGNMPLLSRLNEDGG